MIDDAFDRIFVVSMASSKRRREHIRNHFLAMGISNYEFSDAIVGADLDLEAMKHGGLLADKPPEHGGFDLMPGEVGAAWSHIRVYERSIDLGLRRIMVCEDDIQFRDDANELLDICMKEIPPDWDIVHFQSSRAVGSGARWDVHRKQISEHIYLGFNEGAGASCYALTRRCMKFLLANAYPINKVPDGLTNWPTGWWGECGNYRGYVVDPFLCVAGVFKTDIGPRERDVQGILYQEWLESSEGPSSVE